MKRENEFLNHRKRRKDFARQISICMNDSVWFPKLNRFLTSFLKCCESYDAMTAIWARMSLEMNAKSAGMKTKARIDGIFC